MEMYTRREKNTLEFAYHYIGRAADYFRAIVRPIKKIGSRGEVRAKTEAERQAENRKACYEARAMASAWQGPRYYR